LWTCDEGAVLCRFCGGYCEPSRRLCRHVESAVGPGAAAGQPGAGGRGLDERTAGGPAAAGEHGNKTPVSRVARRGKSADGDSAATRGGAGRAIRFSVIPGGPVESDVVSRRGG